MLGISDYLFTAKCITTKWGDYGFKKSFRSLDSVSISGFVFAFCVLSFHLLCLITLPISCVLVTRMNRSLQIKNLKRWHKLMVKDKSFFHGHNYIELKMHLKDNIKSYQLVK